MDLESSFSFKAWFQKVHSYYFCAPPPILIYVFLLLIRILFPIVVHREYIWNCYNYKYKVHGVRVPRVVMP